MNLFLKIKEMTKRIFLLFILILLSSCQSIKDGLTGKKYESSDEFLVIKKNPLVLPPDFNLLPEPKQSLEVSREEIIEAEIDDILSSIKSENSSANKNIQEPNNTNTEEFVLDQIKN